MMSWVLKLGDDESNESELLLKPKWTSSLNKLHHPKLSAKIAFMLWSSNNDHFLV